MFLPTLRDLCLMKLIKLRGKKYAMTLIPPHVMTETIGHMKKRPPHNHVQFPVALTPIWSMDHAVLIHGGGQTLQQKEQLKKVGYLFVKDMTLSQKKVHCPQCTELSCQFERCKLTMIEVERCVRNIERSIFRIRRMWTTNPLATERPDE